MNNYKPYALDKTRRIAILGLYFIGWIFVIPLLVSIIFHTVGVTDDLMFLFVCYLLAAVILLFMAKPLFLAERSLRIQDLCKILVIGILLLLLINIVLGFFIKLFFSLETSQNQAEINRIQDINPFIYVVTVAVLAPIVEEVVFRGVIFRMIREKKSFLLAAVVSGFAFGLIHVLTSILSGNFIDAVYLLLYGALGVVFAKAYEDTGSIYASIILHGVYNFIAFLLTLM